MAIQETKAIESIISNLICVTKPYYSLENPEQISDTEIQCEVNVENLNSGEATIISAAEAGRHLAILGSCILALNNPVESRHYYLATKAYIKRVEDPKNVLRPENARPVRLFAQARILDYTNRNALVNAELFTFQKHLVYELKVSYQIMKKELFQKFFKKHVVPELSHSEINPYSETPNIKNIRLKGKTLDGYLGKISEEQCLGHFDHYPAFPIAILCAALAKTGGIHLKKILNTDHLTYSTKNADIKAHKLAFAGEEVFVHSTLLDIVDDEYHFNVKAVNHLSEDIGEIDLTLEKVNE